MYPVTLTGRRVRLREFTSSQADIAQSLALVGDDRVTKWLSFDSRNRNEVRDMLSGIVVRARQEPRTEYYLAVSSRGNDAIIGFCRLGLTGVQAGKLGYAINAGDWGKGYATDAASQMVDFGFNMLDLHRISAAIGPDNAASIAIVEHLRFQYEGRIRDHVFTNNAWRDSVLYSVLADEWDQRRLS